MDMTYLDFHVFLWRPYTALPVNNGIQQMRSFTTSPKAAFVSEERRKTSVIAKRRRRHTKHKTQNFYVGPDDATNGNRGARLKLTIRSSVSMFIFFDCERALTT